MCLCVKIKYETACGTFPFKGALINSLWGLNEAQNLYKTHIRIIKSAAKMLFLKSASTNKKLAPNLPPDPLCGTQCRRAAPRANTFHRPSSRCAFVQEERKSAFWCSRRDKLAPRTPNQPQISKRRVAQNQLCAFDTRYGKSEIRKLTQNGCLLFNRESATCVLPVDIGVLLCILIFIYDAAGIWCQFVKEMGLIYVWMYSKRSVWSRRRGED